MFAKQGMKTREYFKVLSKVIMKYRMQTWPLCSFTVSKCVLYFWNSFEFRDVFKCVTVVYTKISILRRADRSLKSPNTWNSFKIISGASLYHHATKKINARQVLFVKHKVGRQVKLPKNRDIIWSLNFIRGATTEEFHVFISTLSVCSQMHVKPQALYTHFLW